MGGRHGRGGSSGGDPLDYVASDSAKSTNRGRQPAPVGEDSISGVDWASSYSKSADKSVAFVEGATHGMTPRKNCNGEYGDTVGRAFDYIANWLNTRY
jgi:hypothetical protein